MLPKRERLPAKDFYSPGYKALKTPYFLLKIRDNNQYGNRIAVVISKSAIKSAVRRNFWRRQVKSILSTIPGNHDFYVSIYAATKPLSKKFFRKQIINFVNNLLS